MELEYQIHALTVSYQKNLSIIKVWFWVLVTHVKQQPRFIGQPLAGFIFLNFGKNVPFYFDVVFLVVVALGYMFLFKNIRKQA